MISFIQKLANQDQLNNKKNLDPRWPNFVKKDFNNLTENEAGYSRIILLIKKRVFKCIMAVYDKKDGVNTGKMKKCRFLHLNYGIRVSYFRSGR